MRWGRSLGTLGAWTPVTTDPRRWSYTVTGLTDGVVHIFEVRAKITDGGVTSYSETAQVRTVESNFGTIQRLQATPGDGEVTLQWSRPDTSLYMRYFHIRWAGPGEDFGEWYEKDVSMRARSFSHEVPGLTNGREYRFQVRAFAARERRWGYSEVTQTTATPGAEPAGGADITFCIYPRAVWSPGKAECSFPGILASFESSARIQPQGASTRLNVEAHVTGVRTTIGSVKFTVTGKPGRTENLKPYALFGDRGGEPFEPGDYEITAVVYSGSRGTGEQLAQSTATLTVEEYPQRISVSDPVADERDEGIFFNVTMSPASSRRVTVDWRTQDDEATAGADYKAGSGTLTFAPDETEKTIEIDLLTDTVEEEDETFRVVLSEPTNARIADDTGLGTITNTSPTTTNPITGFSLVNASTNEVLRSFTQNNATLAAVPEDLLIKLRVDVPGTVPSMLVSLTGTKTASRIENWKPYEVQKIIYPPGGYQIHARIYSDKNGQGIVTATKTLSFSIMAAGSKLQVSNAQAQEGTHGAIEFPVTLTPASTEGISVDWRTADGTAQAGADYAHGSGTLAFAPGETLKLISIPILEDSFNPGETAFRLILSNPHGATLGNTEATGTIVSLDVMPKALLAQFGRVTAQQAVDHIEQRMAAPRTAGFQGRFAGRQFNSADENRAALQLLSQHGAAGGHATGGAYAPRATPADSYARPARTMEPGAGWEARPHATSGGYEGLLQGPLAGSEFEANRQVAGGASMSLWSRSSESYFSGQESGLSLGGRVRTTMLGTDYQTGPLVMGISLGRTQGLGDYKGQNAGQVQSSLTGVYPWLGYRVTDRISVWGMSGYGSGALQVRTASHGPLRAGLSMAVAAIGTRGEIRNGSAGGLGLAFKADALWIGTTQDAIEAPTGRIPDARAQATRVRTAIEGSRGFTFGRRIALIPSVEVGLRQDAGDGQAGTGIDVGSGLVFTDAGSGLSADVRVRMLVAHQAEGFRESGVSVSLGYDPTPATALGFTARVAPARGGMAAGGAEALWRGDMAPRVAGHTGTMADGRFDADIGYGLPVGTRLVGTPKIGVGVFEGARDYRIGYTLGLLHRNSVDFQLEATGMRRENVIHHTKLDHRLRLATTTRW